MNLGTLASKEFDTTDPELAKHLSNANYIASQIGAGLEKMHFKRQRNL